MAEPELAAAGFAGTDRLCRALHHRSPVQSRWRRATAHRRQPALCDEGLAGSRCAGRARPDHRRGRGSTALGKCRTAGRTARIRYARFHLARRSRLCRGPGFRGATPAPGRRRPCDPARRGGARRDRVDRSSRHVPRQWHPADRSGRDQDLDREQSRCRDPGESRGRTHQRRLARRHEDRRHLRQHHLHRRCGPAGLQDLVRSDPAGGAGDLAVPRFGARGPGAGGDGAGVPDRLLHRAVGVRILDQPADLAGAGALDRPRRRRRHRGAGERATSGGSRRAGAGRGLAGFAPGRVRGDRDHDGTGGRVRPGVVHRGQQWTPVPRTCGRAGGGGGDLGFRRAQPDPDDVLVAVASAWPGQRICRTRR